MAKISVVVGVYFNEGSLPHLFAELIQIEQKLEEEGHLLELIFVDDGSGDNSLAELLAIKKQREATRIIKLTRNFGAIHASKIGYQFVTGDCFLSLAADLQEPPELILAMMKKWEAGAKFVLCARTHREDPLTSRLFSHLYYLLLRMFVVKDYPDGGFDLILMDRAFLPYLQNSSKNINIQLFAYWLGFAPEVIHYRRRERIYGKSRWSFAKKVTLFLDSILGFSIVPIRMISFVGLVVSILSFSYGLVIFINAVRGHSDVRGFPTIVALMSFLLGLIIVMLGVIGEYLWRIFDEINKRPEAVIEEVY